MKKESSAEWLKKAVIRAPVKQTRTQQLEDLLIEIGVTTNCDENFIKLCKLLDQFQEGIFPTQFLGWQLLQRSGLGPQERSTILAQSQGLELNAIEEALKRQWDDTELRERDAKAKRFQEKPSRGRAYYGGDSDGGDPADSDEAEEPQDEVHEAHQRACDEREPQQVPGHGR